MQFNSSAINNIEITDDNVVITWKGSNKEYTYEVPDVTNFQMSLNTVIQKEESVGSFVNTSIRNGDLKLQTV